MPKNKVNDPITDQEIVFARLILSGKMSDQDAAEIAGLNPTTAAYTKAKPRVQAWMKEHRAAMDKQILEQESEELRRKTAVRERVLARLWEIADLSYELTKGSNASQMRALAMIVAIEGIIPDRRARSAEKPAPVFGAKAYQSAWLRKQNADPEPGPELQEHRQENEPAVAQAEPAVQASEPSPEPGTISNQEDSTADRPVPRPMTFAEENSSPYTSFVPDTRNSSPFQNPFRRFRR
jgi:hypothetical protein